MKYTAKYFRDTMPEWKRKKDPPLSRVFYRPAGYVLAAIFANMEVGANTVSYISIVEGVLACALFLPNNHICHIIGALLVNLWLVLDCTDGCIARSVKTEPFGEFADGISSYIIVAFLGGTIGIAVFFEGGIVVRAGVVWMVFIGALASTTDTLMRLVYQKYKATELDMVEKGLLAQIEHDQRRDPKQIDSFRVKIEQDLGIGGILPIIILFGAVFRALDLVLLYMLFYYGLSCLLVTFIYIRKARRAEKTVNRNH